MVSLRRVSSPRRQAILAGVLLAAMAVALVATKPNDYWRPIIQSADPLRPYPVLDSVMPKDALDAIRLIRQHKPENFMLGKGVEHKTLILQRIVEGSLPVRATARSVYRIDYLAQSDRKGCRLIASRGRMALSRCGD